MELEVAQLLLAVRGVPITMNRRAGNSARATEGSS
jgi:hypothetical protein